MQVEKYVDRETGEAVEVCRCPSPTEMTLERVEFEQWCGERLYKNYSNFYNVDGYLISPPCRVVKYIDKKDARPGYVFMAYTDMKEFDEDFIREEDYAEWLINAAPFE